MNVLDALFGPSIHLAFKGVDQARDERGRWAGGYSLPNGHVLEMLKSHKNDAGEIRDHWHTRAPDGDSSAMFQVTKYPTSPHPALDQSEAFQRGIGVGRQAMQAMVNHYGSLRSADNGLTSDDAAKAWEALGAIHLDATSRQGHEQEFGDSEFLLLKKDK